MFEDTAVREEAVKSFELEGICGGESPFSAFGWCDDLIFFSGLGWRRSFALAALRGRWLASGVGGRRWWWRLLECAEGEFEIEACAGIVGFFLKCARVIACGGTKAAFLKEEIAEIVEKPRLVLWIEGGFGLAVGLEGLIGLSEGLKDQPLVVIEGGMRADTLLGLFENL